MYAYPDPISEIKQRLAAREAEVKTLRELIIRLEHQNAFMQVMVTKLTDTGRAAA